MDKQKKYPLIFYSNITRKTVPKRDPQVSSLMKQALVMDYCADGTAVAALITKPACL